MSETMMTDAAPNTEGAPDSTTGAPNAQATAQADGVQQQQATEGTTSTDGTNPSADEQQAGTQDGDAAKAGAPEQYEFKAPDGLVFDQNTIGAFSEIAKELDMPQEAAQKILDKVGPVMAKQQAEALEAASSKWADDVKGDKEIGGDKLAESLATAKLALDKFGSPELRALLNESRLGNHPEVIRFMLKAGKAISEDKFVGGTATRASGARDLAKSLYPNQQS